MRKQSLGIDARPVRAAYPPEIIIIEHMFDCPLEEPAQVQEYLAQMTGEALAKLRKRGGLAGEVALKLFDESKRAVASYFRCKRPTDSEATLRQALGKMLNDKMQPGMQVYKVQVVLSDLTLGESSQLCLIGDGERKNRIGRAVDLIRERFGESSIFFASSLAAKGRARVLGRIAA
jgi:DNA polymerase-4